MSRQKLTQQVMGVMLITLLLVGCGAPATTPAPVSPTATPAQTFTLATSTGDIVGTWHTGNYCIRFDKDGTFRQARAMDKLDSQPYTIISYQFEGTKMVITEVSVSGVPTCGIKTGSYEIRLLESGSIQIVAIKDECTQRRNDISKEYEPVR